MLKWVLDDSRVTTALVEMLNRRQMEEDLGAAGTGLGEAERATLARYVRENGTDYCHGCARCRRACPSGVATTTILRALAYHESYAKTVRAREVYAALPAEERADACSNCGACERACPYGVAVRTKVRRAAALLS
jgi:predicted aldo/keto reductase-like oxidoreductase